MEIILNLNVHLISEIPAGLSKYWTVQSCDHADYDCIETNQLDYDKFIFTGREMSTKSVLNSPYDASQPQDSYDGSDDLLHLSKENSLQLGFQTNRTAENGIWTTTATVKLKTYVGYAPPLVAHIFTGTEIFELEGWHNWYTRATIGTVRGDEIGSE